MNKGRKGFPRPVSVGVSPGRTAKGEPKYTFARGFAGFPHDKKLSNPYAVEINATGVLAQKTELRLFSDSIGVGANASPTSLGYMNRINSVFPQFTSVINYSEAGRGIWRMCQIIQSASWTSGPANLAFIVINIALNDVARSGRNNPNFYKTLNKVRALIRSMLLKPLVSLLHASGSSNVTRGGGGTFAGYFANTVGGLYQQLTLPNALAASFVTSGAGATYTWTQTFKHFFIQFIGASGATYSTGIANITVDGVLVGQWNGNNHFDEVTDGVYDNGRGPVCMAFWDFSNASHTVVVTQVSGTVIIDFFASITDNMTICPALLVMEPPYITSQGYYGSPPSQIRGDRVSSDMCTAVLKEEVLFFRKRGYNYGFVETNNKYSLAKCSSDGIHPNNDGHSQLLQAAITGTKSYNQFQQAL